MSLTMKIKTKFLFALIVVFFLALLFYLAKIFLPEEHYLYKKDCTAAFTLRDTQSDFLASFNIFIYMRENNTGYLDMEGKASSKGESYKIARSYSFNYRVRPDGIYHLTEVKISKRASDNVMDVLMNKLIFSNDTATGRYMKVTPLHNSYVVSNLYSPLFVCEIN